MAALAGFLGMLAGLGTCVLERPGAGREPRAGAMGGSPSAAGGCWGPWPPAW